MYARATSRQFFVARAAIAAGARPSNNRIFTLQPSDK
jgi:hypothetical protein